MLWRLFELAFAVSAILFTVATMAMLAMALAVAL